MTDPTTNSSQRARDYENKKIAVDAALRSLSYDADNDTLIARAHVVYDFLSD